MNTDQKIDDPARRALTSTHETKGFKDMTDKEAELMARKNHYAEVLKWQGKLHWDDQPSPDMAAKLKNATHLAG